MKITRRGFCGGAIAGMATACVPKFPEGTAAILPSLKWQRGHFQIHQIYTGVCESYFLIFPDGTSMLLDCGDGDPPTFQKNKFGDKSLPMVTSKDCRAGEWIARYVMRVNPNGNAVDYMLLSHFHGDHSGSLHSNAGVRTDLLPNGEKYHLSGFAQAAQTLHFRNAIDRGWPNYDDPLPYPKSANWMGGSLTVMKKTYRYLAARDGLKVEKFNVGERDQIKLLHDRAAYPNFSVFNLCGNGKVAMKDGSIVDCYANEHPQHKECVYNENAMSLGAVFSYGKFRFYAAGDFTASDGRKGMFNGKKMNIEKILALACDPVTIAKANHHAAWACPNELVSALRPEAWLASVWWQLQCDRDTMNRIASRKNYPDSRLILPGLMCGERRTKDSGEPYLRDVPTVVHTPSHVVVDVTPNGEQYKLFYIDPWTNEEK